MHGIYGKSVFCVILFLVIYSSASCREKQGNNVQTSRVTINVDSIVESLASRFGDDSKIISDCDELVFLQIDGPVKVEFTCGDVTQEVGCEVFSVTRNSNRYFIDANSQPMAYDNMVSSVKKGCRVLKIDEKKFDAWVSVNKREDNRDICMLTAGDKENGRSIVIRRSFDDDKPWRILYGINFTRSVSKK